MKFGFHAYSRSQEAYWSPYESSLSPYDFGMGLVSDVDSVVEPGPKALNNGAWLADRKIPELP